MRDDETLDEQESTHPAELEKKYRLELNASEKDTFYNIIEEFINHTKSAIANRENEE